MGKKVVEPQMPKGVEHYNACDVILNVVAVAEPQMPKGVGHWYNEAEVRDG